MKTIKKVPSNKKTISLPISYEALQQLCIFHFAGFWMQNRM